MLPQGSSLTPAQQAEIERKRQAALARRAASQAATAHAPFPACSPHAHSPSARAAAPTAPAQLSASRQPLFGVGGDSAYGVAGGARAMQASDCGHATVTPAASERGPSWPSAAQTAAQAPPWPQRAAAPAAAHAGPSGGWAQPPAPLDPPRQPTHLSHQPPLPDAHAAARASTPAAAPFAAAPPPPLASPAGAAAAVRPPAGASCGVPGPPPLFASAAPPAAIAQPQQPQQPPQPPQPTARLPVYAIAELGERARPFYMAHVPGRLECEPAGGVGAFHALLRAVCAQGAYDQKRCQWRLSEANVQALRARADVALHVEPLGPIARRVAELASALDAQADEQRGGAAGALPADIFERLRPHQREGVEFGLRCGGRALIADEMGLGKTAVAIALLAAYEADWPALVVAPPTLLSNWKQELNKWLPEELLPNARLQLVAKGKDEIRPDAHVVIVTYALANTMLQKLRDARFGVVVCDESHTLMNKETARSKALGALVRGARRLLLLSGTPAMNKPSELWPQLEMLRPGLFGNWAEYTLRYCAAHAGRHGWDTSGRSNLDELHVALHATVMIRRTKAEALPDLPPKTRAHVHVEPAARDAAALAAAHAAVLASGGAKLSRDSTELTKLYTVSGRAKAAAAAAYVRAQLASGGKVLVFAHHLAVLDALCEALVADGVRHIRIDGATGNEARAAHVAAFQREPDVRCAVLSINAAGVGLTLTAAWLVVFAELSWSVASMQQAEDRAHRIGQRRAVEVVYLLMRQSIDDLIWPTVNRKLDTVSRALDGHTSSMQPGAAAKRPPPKLGFDAPHAGAGAGAKRQSTGGAVGAGGGGGGGGGGIGAYFAGVQPTPGGPAAPLRPVQAADLQGRPPRSPSAAASKPSAWGRTADATFPTAAPPRPNRPSDGAAAGGPRKIVIDVGDSSDGDFDEEVPDI